MIGEIKKLVGTLRFCPGKHQFVKTTFCDCLDKCKINSTIMAKSKIYCEFENKLTHLHTSNMCRCTIFNHLSAPN